MGSRILAGIPEHLLGPHVVDAGQLEWTPEGCGGDCDCAPCSGDDDVYEYAIDMRSGRASRGGPWGPPPIDDRVGGDPGTGPDPGAIWEPDIRAMPVPHDVYDDLSLPGYDPLGGDPPGPPPTIDDYQLECQIVPRPPPRLNPTFDDRPGGLVGYDDSGLESGLTGGFTLRGTTTAASAAGPADAAADDLFTTAPEICPPGYTFDYDAQACYWDGDGPRPTVQPADMYEHACDCPAGESFLIGGRGEGQCWKWGSGVQLAGFPKAGGLVSEGEQDCPLGWVWDDVSRRCLFDECPPGFADATYGGGQCVEALGDENPFVHCYGSSVLSEPSPAMWTPRTWGRKACADHLIPTINDLYSQAYRMCRIAELELDYIETLSHEGLLQLWHAYVEHEESSLSFWFGDLDFGGGNLLQWTEVRFNIVREVVKAVSRAFRHGFKAWHDPVTVKCHDDCDQIARHLTQNAVTLCPPFWGHSEADQVTTILHEMFHWSLFPASTNPRDRNNPICAADACTDGTDCYQCLLFADEIFTGGAPRDLVLAFEAWDDAAGDDMIYNIDNYMSWIWNRWQDRKMCRINVP